MSEEIDIIELLQRIKEGKAPKKIMINNEVYDYNNEWYSIEDIYKSHDYIGTPVERENIFFDTKIKILDKPIIEEMKIHKNDNDNPILIKKDGKTNNLRTIDVEIINKINEIIRVINNKENKDE